MAKRIPTFTCFISCCVFILLAGWMGQLGAYFIMGAFLLVALIMFGMSLLGYLNQGIGGDGEGGIPGSEE